MRLPKNMCDSECDVKANQRVRWRGKRVYVTGNRRNGLVDLLDESSRAFVRCVTQASLKPVEKI